MRTYISGDRINMVNDVGECMSVLGMTSDFDESTSVLGEGIGVVSDFSTHMNVLGMIRDFGERMAHECFRCDHGRSVRMSVLGVIIDVVSDFDEIVSVLGESVGIMNGFGTHMSVLYMHIDFGARMCCVLGLDHGHDK